MFEQILNPNSYLFWFFILIIIGAVFVLIIRNFATYVKFVYPNAKYEAIGNPFIIEKELSGLIETKTIDHVRDRLNVLRDYQLSGETAAELQQSLDDNFLRTIKMMRNDNSKKLHDFYDLYLLKNDLYLVKNVVKNILIGNTKRQVAEIPMLSTTKKMLLQLQSTKKEEIAPILSPYGFEQELLETLGIQPPDFLRLDMMFDKHILRLYNQLKVPNKCDKAKQEFIKNLIDIMTIKNMLRAKQLGYPINVCKTMFLGDGTEISRWRFEEMAESTDVSHVITALDGTSYFPELTTEIEQYHKEQSVQVFITILDGALLKRAKLISLRYYQTLGPTLRFLISKEYEIQNLKVIVKGIGEHLSSELIKKNLVTEVTL